MLLVEVLVSWGAQPIVKDMRGCAPLHTACWQNHLGVVKVLLGGSQVREQLQAVNSDGQTALVIACLMGNDQVVLLLQAAGADLNALAPCGLRPLHAAVKQKHACVVAMLLAAGADASAVDRDKQSALQLAAAAGSLDIMQMLLAAGADTRAMNQQQQNMLHAAVVAGRPELVQMLLAAGADPRVVDEKQQTVLHVAIAAGRPAIAHMVLAALAVGQYRGDVNAMAQGMTALHMAIHKKLTSCVEGLLAAGADPNKLLGPGAVHGSGTSVAGGSSLWYAVVCRHADAILLLSNPTSLRQRTWKGQTPLHQALCGDKPDIAQLLIDAGSPTGLADNNGVTAMSFAARSSKPAIRALLPAMVRSECQLHLQQEQEEEEGYQLEHAAVPAAVEDVLYEMLRPTTAASEERAFEEDVACCSMVLDVLGAAATSSLLLDVLERCNAPVTPAAAISCGMRLLKLAHTGWLAALEPLLHQRQTVTSRLQWLVTQPLQQQQEQQQQDAGAAPASGRQQVSCEQQRLRLRKQLWGEALVVGDAGQWGLLVQRLEQLAGLQPSECRSFLYVVATQRGWVRPPAVVGLCDALLGALAAGRQQATRRAVQEVADGVVSAVQAWEQHQVIVAGMARRRQRLHEMVEWVD
jgi:ankyrin repeat protein